MVRPIIRNLDKVVVLVISSILSVYAAEGVLRFLYPETSITELNLRRIVQTRQELAREANVDFDPRTKLEMVEALRAEGIDAYPSVFPSLYLTERRAKNHALPDLLPIGGLANVTVVPCNESGEYMIYQSDENGFNNPTGLYGRRPIDVVLVGDSYTQGLCVPRGAAITTHLEAAGYSSYSLGLGGNGPLVELASLKEYAEPVSPGVVLWMFFEGNDFIKLRRELKDPILRHYLEAGFSQGLLDRRAEVDAMHRAFIAAREESLRKNSRGAKRKVIRSFLRLKRLRLIIKWINSAPGKNGPHREPSEAEMQEFAGILAIASHRVSQWGGGIVFCLPALVGKPCGFPRRESAGVA